MGASFNRIGIYLMLESRPDEVVRSCIFHVDKKFKKSTFMRTHSMKYVIVVFSLDTQEIKADVCKCVDDSGIWTATERVKVTTGKICDVCKVAIFLRRVHISPNSQFIKKLKLILVMKCYILSIVSMNVH